MERLPDGSLVSKKQAASSITVYRFYLGYLASAVILLSGTDSARLVYDQSVIGFALYRELHVGSTCIHDDICDCKKKGVSDFLSAHV